MAKRIVYCLFCIGLFASCNTSKQIVYFQDYESGIYERTRIHPGIVIQPQDMLSIVVSCKNPELSAPFNLPIVSYQAGNELSRTGYNQKLLGYAVSSEGTIDFPVLGMLKVSGMTRWELAEVIKGMIMKEHLIKDPVVTVEFMNFRVSVIGEVHAPGTYTITGDKVTILEAISMAKDLTIFGKRDNIAVYREKDNRRIMHRVDLRSRDIFTSPVYYLQQNDIIYVEPNKTRAGQSNINENSFKSVSLWLSVVSLAGTMVLLFK